MSDSCIGLLVAISNHCASKHCASELRPPKLPVKLWFPRARWSVRSITRHEASCIRTGASCPIPRRIVNCQRHVAHSKERPVTRSQFGGMPAPRPQSHHRHGAHLSDLGSRERNSAEPKVRRAERAGASEFIWPASSGICSNTNSRSIRKSSPKKKRK